MDVMFMLLFKQLVDTGVNADLFHYWTSICISVAVKAKSGSAVEHRPVLAQVFVNHTYLKQPESDQIAAWVSGGAGLFTDEILQTVRDPTSLCAQRTVCL